MYIKQIELDGFRNIAALRAEFDEKTNIIIGDNANGKTNLLESIYYLTGARSFRTRTDRELIGFDGNSALIRGSVFSEGRDRIIEARLFRDRRKALYINGVKIKTGAELGESFRAVLFCPEDLYLIRDGAAARRRFMDMAIGQLRPRYVSILSEYNRLYEHKTRILRDYHEKPSLLDALDEFNYRMAQAGAEIISFRASFVKALFKFAAVIHSEFSGGRDELTLIYKTVKTVDDPLKPPAEIFPLLSEHQKAHKQAELNSGLCLSGPHKDDLEISINGRAAKSYASQGQTRTAALSLKLAERELQYDDTGETPVLLLDDVLSELDASRQDFVLNRIKTGQVFITCCEGEKIAKQTGGRVLTIDNGQLIIDN